MFGFTKSPGRSATLPVAALVLAAGAILLTGCQTAAIDAVDPQPTATVGPAAAPLPADLRGLPADRIEHELEARAAAQRELAERFAGIPVDRIVERLEREARG